MKICIDGLGSSWLNGTGLYSYTSELLNNLFESYPQPKYDIIWDNPEAKPIWESRHNIDFINPELNRKNNEYSNLEKYLVDNKINIFHSPNNGLSIPSNKVCKYVMTVHDLLPVINKDMVDSKFQKKFMTVFPESIKRADKIIAVSDYIKKRLVKSFKIEEGKIKVIYPGCPKQFRPIKDNSCRELLKEKYNVEGEYILYAGSIHQRKNIELVLRGFRRLLKSRKSLNLVIAGSYEGKRYEYFKSLESLCRQMGIDKQVLFIGRVDYNDMPALYNGAVCAVNASIHEGFPLTTIEAMACGTPAISLESSIFTEVAGNGCLFIKDDEDFEVAVTELLTNSDFRSEIIHKGLHQSRKYTWDNHIKKLVNVYESVVY